MAADVIDGTEGRGAGVDVTGVSGAERGGGSVEGGIGMSTAGEFSTGAALAGAGTNLSWS